jgi:hypothetical protein
MGALREQEVTAVCSLSADERVEYFIKRAVGYEEVWGLKEDGWKLSANSSGLKVFQVWPFDDYAKLCCVGEWAGCVPASMPLDLFLDTFVPNLNDQRIAVGVFYTPSDAGVLMPPYDLAKRMRDYEDEWY